MQKRSFLLGACGAAMGTGAAALPAGDSLLEAARALPILGQAPRAGHWRAYLDQPFELHAEGNHVAVVLESFEPVAGSMDSEQFVLGFRSAQAAPSGLYELVHANGTRLALSLTAHAPSQQAATRLRAEFNLLAG